MKKYFSLILGMSMWLGSIQAQEKTTQVSNGKLIHIPDFSSKYIESRNVDIWLPEDYNNQEKYAVLYMHDGQMLFDSTTTWNKQEWGVDETFHKLLNEGKIRKTIIIAIWNIPENRHADYFPEKPFKKLPKAFRDSLLNEVKRNAKTALFKKNIQSDNYLKFIVKELKPYIDKNYSTLSDVSNTFIAGSSMGGLISMYAICEYPKVFGGAACLSTHWPGIFTVKNNPIPEQFLNYLKENLPDPGNHKLYFDYGTETLDALYESFQLKADKIIASKGYTSQNWLTKKFEGANHSENAWKERLDIPLLLLLRL